MRTSQARAREMAARAAAMRTRLAMVVVSVPCRYHATEMVGLTEDQLAVRSATTPAEIRRLSDLGIVLADEDGTYRQGNIARVRMAQALEASGMALEDIGRAIGRGDLSLAFLDLLFSEPVPYTGTTYRDLCSQSGLTFEFVERIHEAIGLPQPKEDGLVREDDAQMFPLAQFTLGMGMNETEVLRVLRVYGDNLGRVAKAETQFFHSYIEEPLIGAG